ncbi:uncharacterized protein [Acropora muricata]|uniref:uncharacterized protein isoform X2 n=1 Tax=Acropora muricata TaxID=159855 RepID=UPI0034E57D5F
MEYLTTLPLKTQTIAGGVRFIFSVVAIPVLIKRLDSYDGKDRLAFNCNPKPNEVAKQGCYSRYTADMSALLTPYTFTCITGVFLLVFWSAMTLYSVKCLQEFRKASGNERKRHLSYELWQCFLFHVLIEAAFLSVMMVVFCHSQTVFLPEVYNCPQRNSSMHTASDQKENLTCSDLYYKQKSEVNVGILGVMSVILFFCIVALCHAWWKRNDFTYELVDWDSSGGEDDETMRTRLKEVEEDNKTTRTRLGEVEESTTKRLREMEEDDKTTRRRLWEVEESTTKRLREMEEGNNTTRRRLWEVEEDNKTTRRRLGEVEEDNKTTRRRLGEVEEDNKTTRRRLGEVEERQRSTNTVIAKLEDFFLRWSWNPLQLYQGSTKQSSEQDSRMASDPAACASTQEHINYASLSRLLIDVGTKVLCDTFNSIHPPANLHMVLSNPPVLTRLKSLKAKGVLYSSQWKKLFPDDASAVSSANFDATLLFQLLRNTCGLQPPPSTDSWNKLPDDSDDSIVANIVRMRHYRNEIHAHALTTSVDDATFKRIWEKISHAILALGSALGSDYEPVIRQLKTDCMDYPLHQKFLSDWKKGGEAASAM